ncbi:cupin domain-containing protein [Octadecabacter sp. 1_MG-2023]|uniref:cupin domain-containing protein n=1 Tax=unclassified Octadecabacter TaxID=196158 RepID=UPI001C0A0B8A|nr:MULTISPECIES: cupin domain-containing protein [unclassified Octadecabacter]MBU2991715.1 cupin domain-containing protein [Octadecabacter sp. B2R22]MDO6735688.1 cupin domain-containing protein [Octadecabacter sp. 1_MG-2023]
MTAEITQTGTKTTAGVVVRYDDITPFARGDLVETRLMIGKAASEGAPFTTGTTIFPAGSAAPLHSHNCAEQVTILSGSAEAMIGGDVVQLGPMDTSFVPADVPHYFRNTGTGPLTILWIYGAREVTRTFVETGETVAHMSPRDQV